MNILNLILIVITIVIVIYLSKRSAVKKNKPERNIAPKNFESLSLKDVEDAFIENELITRLGFLHYDLSTALPVEEEQVGLFVGFAKTDETHDGRICVYDSEHTIRGYVDAQPKLYERLMTQGKTPVYGFISREENKAFRGEVCIRVR
ncbi:hypothetical protein ETF27_03075 [Prevotella brunnea]|uniref:HIRAN domain-containing protein n=1 Tax=Prevotella brunnea TaxID=2508867 RepID=A0A5C8GL61_9BACT|nr:hypothetical protein [Prevotella brunnea]MDR0186103.1 hypothetical protein [Prevotella brunnea]TXJ62746.1 hypothetical protein ETF27_03075 [Prevotella brunnea]